MRTMTITRRAALTGLLGGAALGFTACTSSGYPADPDGTLDRVTGGVLRVGVVHTRLTWTSRAPSPSAPSPT